MSLKPPVLEPSSEEEAKRIEEYRRFMEQKMNDPTDAVFEQMEEMEIPKDRDVVFVPNPYANESYTLPVKATKPIVSKDKRKQKRTAQKKARKANRKR